MAAKGDAAILERIRQLRDACQALPPGEARIAAIRNDFMPWVISLLQDLDVHTALTEIALHAAAGVTGDDRKARRERVLKGYPAALYELRAILPTAETGLVVGDLKAMDAGRVPFALYPRKEKKAEARQREIREQCVLRAEYDAAAGGIKRKHVIERHNAYYNTQLPVRRFDKWASGLSNERKQRVRDIGKKKHDGIALSEEEQKLLEAIERNTFEELVWAGIAAGGLAGSRPRSRSRSVASAASGRTPESTEAGTGDGDGSERR